MRSSVIKLRHNCSMPTVLTPVTHSIRGCMLGEDKPISSVGSLALISRLSGWWLFYVRNSGRVNCQDLMCHYKYSKNL